MTSLHHAGNPGSPGPTGHSAQTAAQIEVVERYAAHNYHPLPVVLTSGEGAWVTDVDGRRYLDCLAGYSALNFGHGHPRLLARAQEQLARLTLTSRAFHNDQLGPFAEALAGLTGKDMILPMNTGAEAVETALKVARKWGYRVKGVPEGTRQHRGDGGQLPRPHHHHRQLLRRQDRARRVRPLHTGFPHGHLRGCRCAAPRRSTTPRSPCCSSRCRARAASSSRPRATCARCARSATRPAP